MDETTFKSELVSLKQRVAQMASTYSPLVSSGPHGAFQSVQPVNDAPAFSHQLDELKGRIQAMQAGLNQFTAVESLQPPVPFSQVHNSADSITPGLQSALSLPTGPLFWQLFTSLRSDFRGLDGRIAMLEQNFSNLEDRVDGLDPKQFTPASSDAHSFDYPQQSSVFVPPSFFDQQAQRPFGQYAAQALNGFEYCQQPPLISAKTQCGNEAEKVEAELPTDGDYIASGIQAAPAEGVAFRDKEIVRLEELIQESLRHHEDLVCRNEAEIGRLNSAWHERDTKVSELERILEERNSIIRAYSSTIAEKDGYLENLHAENQSKDDVSHAWASRHYTIQQAFIRKKAQLCHSENQVQQLQHALYETQRIKQDELNGKDAKIRKLREFCEAKRTISDEQDDLIARGAKIIQDRDDEIERNNKQLKVLSDDLRNESRDRARFARLLQERDEEVEQLKASLTQALTPESKSSKVETTAKGTNTEGRSSYSPPVTAARGTNTERHLSCSPFAIARSASKRGSPASAWTPQAIDNYATLPWEVERAAMWEKGSPSNDRCRFGVPGLASPSHPDGDKTPGTERRDLRRSDSLKLLSKLALAEEGASRPARSIANANDQPKRSKLPLDEVAARPPLPAPLSPPKMASVGDLRDLASMRRHDDGHQQSLSRHQSIQHLPRRRQAYVEDA